MYCEKCGNLIVDSASCCEFCGSVIDRPVYKIDILSDLSHNLDALRIIMEAMQLSPTETKVIFKEKPYIIERNFTLLEASSIQAQLSSKGILSKINSPLAEQDVKNASNNTEQEEIEDENSYTESSTENIWPAIVKCVLAICFILAIYFVSTEFDDFIYKLKTGDFSAASNIEYTDVAYIELVKTLCPYTNGRSYGEAFAEEFDVNKWSYFKSGNKQVVQVISSYNDIDETLVTQFLITPTSNIDQFEITPYAMFLNGKEMSSLEIQATLAAVFDGETIDALGELFFYANLY